uniref:G-protein coupled receptors family 1 profile domain-containing protein n=1 Tax=Salvator merianae TaxID=96440 RepID=A0A8D0KCQ2_SALMN
PSSNSPPYAVSDWLQSQQLFVIATLVRIKGCLYLANFIFITAVTILIVKTMRKKPTMKKEIRYFLLCHHLLCSSLYCCFGMVSNMIQMFHVKQVWIWITFGVQAAVGKTVLVTLALMAMNTCLAICWPLRYPAFLHAVKLRVIICVWIGTILISVCLIIAESAYSDPEEVSEVELSCPALLSSNFAKITGIALILLLSAIITTAYFFLYREGKHRGHFNSSNKKARKTIIFHGLQISFYIIPSLIIRAIGKDAKYTAVKFAAFVFFIFAQSFSPVVYGLRNKELQEEICMRPRRKLSSNDLGNLQLQKLQLTQSSENQ